MRHSAFKIFGISVLLCGLTAALPQAQIRTGISSQGTQETSAPAKAAKDSQQQQPATPQVSGKRRRKPMPIVQEQPPAPVVAPPVEQIQVPLRPEQMPPGPPKVSYQNGLLSVESTNSTLGDILNMIRTKTGIQIEGLQGASDRVAAKLGPASADTVLTSLLRGSHFDYLILASVDRPDIVQRVILTPSSSSGLSINAGIQPLQPRPGMVLVQPIDEDEGNPEEQAGVPQPQIQPIQQPGVQPQQPIQQSGNGQLQGNSPKTTEQLLEELKQMQQQQQQNQPNQQNLQPPPPLKPRIPQ
jgi:hypothetical protein